MKFTAVKFHPKDNVVVVLKDVKAGETVSYADGNREIQMTVTEDIPIYHKTALISLKTGMPIIKYGERLGLLTADVKEGGWVSHLNLASQPRDYESEF